MICNFSSKKVNFAEIVHVRSNDRSLEETMAVTGFTATSNVEII
jgi:hypothetical protein